MGLTVPDQAMVKGALLTGWFFTLRASELLPHGDGSDPLDRAIRPADVAFYKGGQACLGTVADEVVIQVRSSKTDQFGRGQARSHHRSGGDLCPVEAASTTTSSLADPAGPAATGWGPQQQTASWSSQFNRTRTNAKADLEVPPSREHAKTFAYVGGPTPIVQLPPMGAAKTPRLHATSKG